MKTIIGTAAIAALGLVGVATMAPYARAQAAAAAPQTPAKKGKQVKDTGEYDIYNEVIKDAAGNPPNAKKFLADLDTWTQKYPDTEFKDNRVVYYVQAYAANNDLGKAMDAAKPLIDKGIDGLKDSLSVENNDGPVLQFLFLAARTAGAYASTGTPNADQAATGEKACQMLTDFGKVFFASDKKPANMTADQWAQGLKQVEDQADLSKFQIAIGPGVAATKANPNDPAANAAAEAAFKKAGQSFPNSGVIAQQIGNVSLKQQAADPKKAQQAIFYFARAVSLPTGGIGGLDAAGQKNLDTYLTRVYTQYHGSDEGLAQLKDMAAKNPVPPSDFEIRTASQMAAAAQAEFQSKNPQLAMWMNIKGQLADTNGQQYFEEQLKEHDMSGEGGQKLLKGTLVDAKPSTCRPKELLVGFPTPGASGAPNPEVTLKLDAPLTGKVETGTDISFNGVPAAFVKDPFMLTMDTDKSKIDGLTTTPCAAAPVTKKAPTSTTPKAPPKKG